AARAGPARYRDMRVADRRRAVNDHVLDQQGPDVVDVVDDVDINSVDVLEGASRQVGRQVYGDESAGAERSHGHRDVLSADLDAVSKSQDADARCLVAPPSS